MTRQPRTATRPPPQPALPPPPQLIFDAQLEHMIDRIASRAAAEAVDRAFKNIGLDASDPAAVRAYHADQSWLRATREGVSRLGTTAKASIITPIVTAILFLIWSAIQRGGPH